ncbi:hypothetical protein CR535_05510 [Escherichia coli]|nr:hypothetical protein CR535_05510 [Escherichia coli]
MSNFINIHVLISHSPSCLNRDDMNMQKDAIFGGKRRVRISSQSLKRAMRKSDYYAQNIGESSLRTIHLAQLRDVLRQKLSERFDQKIIDKTLALLSGKSVDEAGNDSNLLIVFYVQIMPDDFVMQLHRF